MNTAQKVEIFLAVYPVIADIQSEALINGDYDLYDKIFGWGHDLIDLLHDDNSDPLSDAEQEKVLLAIARAG